MTITTEFNTFVQKQENINSTLQKSLCEVSTDVSKLRTQVEVIDSDVKSVSKSVKFYALLVLAIVLLYFLTDFTNLLF